MVITDFGSNGSLTEIFMHHMPRITLDNLEYINALNEIISIMVLLIKRYSQIWHST